MRNFRKSAAKRKGESIMEKNKRQERILQFEMIISSYE